MRFRKSKAAIFLFLFHFILILSLKTEAQFLNKKQQDSAFLSHPGQELIKKIKKSLAKTFVDFVGNDISLFGSLDFTKQNINDKGITAPLNYLYNNVNENALKPGFTGGFRIDGIYKEKHLYSLSLAINRISVGNFYNNKYTLSPFIDDFTHFKADNSFTTINIATHYKKLLPLNDMKKFKFYAVLGTSLEYKISNITNENLVNNAGNRTFINGDLGAEFDNNGYYIFFTHYKLGTNLFHSTVPVLLNRFEIGMSFKVKDLF